MRLKFGNVFIFMSEELRKHIIFLEISEDEIKK